MVTIAFWCAVFYTASNVYAGHTGIIAGFTQIGDWSGVSMMLRVFCGGSAPRSSSKGTRSTRSGANSEGASSSDDEFGCAINPATGYMMFGGIDIGCNAYGCSDNTLSSSEF